MDNQATQRYTNFLENGLTSEAPPAKPEASIVNRSKR